MNSVAEDTRAGHPPSTSCKNSENSEEPPRKILKVSSNACKIAYDAELHDAVKRNDISSVRAILLRQQSSVEAGDYNGNTALHIAAYSDNKEIVQMLLTAGASTRIQNDLNQTPLHLALRWNKNCAAEVLVNWDAGEAPNDLQDDRGRTPLYFAVIEGHTEIVKKLVAAGANTCLSDAAGRTPLHVAIYYRKEDAANALIECGAVNDLQNKDGRSPLHFAISEGYVEICKKLLAAGCNVRLQDHRGSSPLHLALNRRDDTVAMVLVDVDSENDLQDVDGFTPLHLASKRGFIPIVQKLLSARANRYLKDNKGRTPLHIALERENELVVEILIDSVADNEIQCEDQKPLLHFAARMKWASVVRKLLFCDVHPHTKDSEGVYPLKSALKYKSKEIVKMILSVCSLKGIAINWEELDLTPDESEPCIKLLSKYDAETQRMKSTMIPGTSVSFHDLAKRFISTVAQYLSNELIQKILSSDNTIEEFPNYAELIAFKMEKAKHRKILTDQFLKNFDLLSRKLPSIPTLCVNIIILFLSNQDMQNFVEAFKFKP
ncbi:ankyrin repeat and protein kinase domain-containing protein 1-like isoform X1 [Uloborus diversus]|uniref:ankyrin repeat and protein kinase domain-containing protein 1-like isoform X1 n=2 Tax=Uloborus diversus TaxID=327109 RepID=UPI00240A8A29|nr:ankyrin repeat and protein kinase domain-containing protein 1-like isoform X1 [Uloborus diversus]XP_054719812.1 ankyrin repeat and protein kinase domain-containing protein 1-like isoform X1 [Uloborus diversus]